MRSDLAQSLLLKKVKGVFVEKQEFDERVFKVIEEIRALSFRLTGVTHDLSEQKKHLENATNQTYQLDELKLSLNEKSHHLDEKINRLKLNLKN